MDVVVGSVGLVAALPVLVAIAVAMRRSGDHGPFLYRATRVGEGGRPFTILKIRTMTAGSSGSRITTRDDDRVTPVGATVRRYRLDELPQLVNVVRGEMSLVGPRPEDPAYVDLDDPLHRRGFSPRPGVTRLAPLTLHDEAPRLSPLDPPPHHPEGLLPPQLPPAAGHLLRHAVPRHVATLLPRA